MGCGEKATVEPVADVKPVEEKNGLKDNITGKAFTIKSPDSDEMAKLIFGGDSKFSINADGIKVSEGSFIIDGLQVKVTEDVTSQADVYQFHSVKPKVGDQVSMIDGPYDKLSIVKIEPAGNIIANPIATILSFAMALKYSLDLDKESNNLEKAVQSVLDEGLRTKDILSKGTKEVSTSQMGDAIISKLK